MELDGASLSEAFADRLCMERNRFTEPVRCENGIEIGGATFLHSREEIAAHRLEARCWPTVVQSPRR